MNVSNIPDLASADDVRQALARHGVPLLLNFTAGWCQPCKTFAPVLGAVAGAHADLIAIMRVDVDACRDLAREYGVRGVPTSILLRDGVEQDRLVGAKSQRAFVQWLAARGVPLPVPPDDHAPRVAFGAFHGDESLKRFLVERLYRHMDDGQVRLHVAPSWQDGSGTVSGALVHHASPDVFEGVTGLPYGFACALEFTGLERRQHAEAVFEALAPGLDVRHVPLRLMRAWLGDGAIEWTRALDSVPHDTLRRDWLALSGALADGADIPADRWAALRKAARALASPDGDPYRQLEDDLAALVEHLSPPPGAQEADEWRAILVRSTFARARLVEYRAGWTKEDIAQPLLRHRFFLKHVPLDTDGGYDMTLFESKRAEWERGNQGFLARESELHEPERYAGLLDGLCAPFRPLLAELLRRA
jgi:thioredoxin 1